MEMTTTALNSFFLVFAAEMGDKTQLLALVLASRFRRPWPILAGILCATLANHALAALVGQKLADLLPAAYLPWILAAVFFGFAAWILIPDKDDGLNSRGSRGAFFTTLITFFIAEMGDKTQLATIALGARYNDAWMVTLGTTLGMLAANGPFVFFGEQITKKISLRWIRFVASALFVAFGVGILLHHP